MFDSLDSLLITVPVILRYREAFREERNKQILLAINSIRTTKEAGEYAIVFSDLLISNACGPFNHRNVLHKNQWTKDPFHLDGKLLDKTKKVLI